MTTRILYIEDNDQNFYLVSFIMTAKGYAVVRARDGREGIDLALAENPDLVLLDIQLPVMDGYTTARELRKNPAMKLRHVISLTSYAMAGDREKVIAAGCTGLIEKPINPKTFIEQIEQYFTAENPEENRT